KKFQALLAEKTAEISNLEEKLKATEQMSKELNELKQTHELEVQKLQNEIESLKEPREALAGNPSKPQETQNKTEENIKQLTKKSSQVSLQPSSLDKGFIFTEKKR